MGLFSKKEAGSSRRQAPKPRPSVSSEAQAATLRVKARRRLTGAVALVLAVVIVLPILLDGEPKPVPSGIDITIPNKNQPLAPLTTTSIQTPVTADSAAQAPLSAIGEPESSSVSSDALTPVSPSAVEKPATAVSETTVPPATPPAASTATTPPKPETPPPPAAARAAEPTRTDDGSRALALLEGRTPEPVASAAAAGQFVVQVASYSAEGDAQSRRDKLRGEGVSNAFVEQGAIEGKSVFRLRVGPFASRDAAQAAQTRLRTLGYSNGFITTQ